MVTKAYLRASEDSITGAKQKVHTFQARIKVVYYAVRKQQEDEDAKESHAPKPSMNHPPITQSISTMNWALHISEIHQNHFSTNCH